MNTENRVVFHCYDKSCIVCSYFLILRTHPWASYNSIFLRVKMRINIENACSCDILFDLLVWEESREIKTYAYRFEFEELILDVVMLNILIAIFFWTQVLNSIISKNAYKYDMHEECNCWRISSLIIDYDIAYENHNRWWIHI